MSLHNYTEPDASPSRHESTDGGSGYRPHKYGADNGIDGAGILSLLFLAAAAYLLIKIHWEKD